MEINSELAFSQVREDPVSDLRVIERLSQARNGQPLRVLLVASGGCTALSLLSSAAVAQIDAVDLNPAQLHLVELRRRAIAFFPIPQQLILIGGMFGEAPQRLALYKQLRSHLPSPTQAYWDDRQDQIAFGVNRVGKFEQLFRRLASQAAILGIHPLEQPLAAIAHPQWQALFESVFERSQLVAQFGEAAVNYSMDRSFGAHFADVFAESLRRFKPQENYFLTQVWSDRYYGSLPLYLQPDIQAKILKLGGDRLQLHQGPFAAMMPQLAATDPYDVIQFSNISDWMPIPALRQMLAQAARCLSPGGALIGRRLNGDHCLADLMATAVAVDREFSHDLQQQDRSFFYSEIVVGYRQ